MGNPGQADPTVDANNVIHMTISPSVQGGVDGHSEPGGASALPANRTAGGDLEPGTIEINRAGEVSGG